jgi:hypothetical protein
MFVRTCGVFTERTLKQKMQADFQRIMDAQTLANEKESMLAEGGRIES